MPNPTATSPRGINLIKTFESCRLTAYNDNPQNPDMGKWTIGWGQTGPWVRPGITITQRVADDTLVADLRSRESAVAKMVSRIQVRQWEFDALIDFAYNLGLAALQGSTLIGRLLQTKPDTRDRRLVATEFSKWVYQGQTMLDGLLRRRMAEADLYLNGGDKRWWQVPGE